MLQDTEAYGAHTLGLLSHRITHFFVSRFMFSHVYKIGFAKPFKVAQSWHTVSGGGCPPLGHPSKAYGGGP
jgi:hypothetical protein